MNDPDQFHTFHSMIVIPSGKISKFEGLVNDQIVAEHR